VLDASQASLIPAKCIYSLRSASHQGIQKLFYETFPGQLSYPYLIYDAVVGPPEIRAIYNNSLVNLNTISSAMDSIAAAMTLRIRELQNDGLYTNFSSPMIGQVWETETCIAVRWGYLAFLAAVTVGTIAFLLVLIIQDGCRNGDLLAIGWKSSPLPLIHPGLAEIDEAREDLNAGSIKAHPTIWELEKRARSKKARLR
jgi:hypothetical protein